jgi:Zn-dependent M16 (insulinase) family peptidase
MSNPDFQLIQDVPVPSLQGRACRFRHSSGLEVLCLDIPDRENLFALHFSTPPVDNTGVPHILEHAVLSGSKKYPLKDPFIELIKSSLATFINAMTFADYTVYPVCSCHEKDFFNLAEVYWDSVFHPLLTRQSFQQEGWHFEIGKGSKGRPRLEINGIVLNEMNGAYAEMENVLERSVWQHLLPDSHLAFDSGGHPEHIPMLSYEQFLNYYQTHYQPEKAKVIFTGNIPTERKFDFLRQQLRGVPRAVARPNDNATLFQLRKWRLPRKKRVYYVPEPGDQNLDSGALALVWRIDSRRDPDLDLAMQLLDRILLGNSAAPIVKTLLESGLCSAMTSSGYDDNYFQTIFQIAVRGCRMEHFDQLERLIFQCLEEQAKGISKKRVQAALRQLQLDHAEITPDFTLEILEDILAAWNYNCDPTLFLNQEKTWEKLENKLDTQENFIENLIKKYFLENPHRLRLELLPDPKLLVRREKRVSARLRKLQSAMTAQELQHIRQEQVSLRKAQQKADPAAARRKLPRLRLEHLAPQPPRLPVKECRLSNQLPLLVGEVFTNRVSYLQIAFDLSTLPTHLSPVLPIFANFFHQVGTSEATYDLIAEQQAEASTSIRSNLAVCNHANGTAGTKNLFYIYMHCLDECLPDALELLRQQIKSKCFKETKRCQELLREHWTQILAELQGNAIAFATLRSAAGITGAASLLDDWNGFPHVRRAKHWKELKPQDFRKNLDRLDELALWLAGQTPCAASCAGSAGTLQKISAFLEQFPAALQSANHGSIAERMDMPCRRREFFPLHADVSWFARVIAAPHLSDPHSAALEIYAQLLSCGHLWREIRLKNGAYGVHCQYSPLRRTLILQSSDDPNPARTRTVFDQLPKATAALPWNDRDISDAIIACSRGDERPWRPAQIVHSALLNRISGLTEELRAQRRRALLDQTPESVREGAAHFWTQFSARQNDCLLGPSEYAKQLDLSTFHI